MLIISQKYSCSLQESVDKLLMRVDIAALLPGICLHLYRCLLMWSSWWRYQDAVDLVTISK